jgi:hypothetical protein
MTFQKLLFALCTILLLSSCGAKNNEPEIVAEDVPLSQFIIGRWQYMSEVNTENRDDDIELIYMFEEGNVVKIWTGDGVTCKYEFIGSNEISVDCSPRNLYPFTLNLERDGQFLLVDSPSNELRRFQRINQRTIIFE